MVKKYDKSILDKFEKSIIKEEVDIDIILQVLSDEINNNKLSSAVKRIVVSKDYDNNMYDHIKRVIFINPEIIRRDNDEIENVYFKYESSFDTIYHELEHAKQRVLLDKWDRYYSKLNYEHNYTKKEMQECLSIILLLASSYCQGRYSFDYRTNYDCYPSEHQAIYNAFYNSSSLLSDLSKEYGKKYGKHINNELFRKLTNGYYINYKGELVSPISQISNSRISQELIDYLNSDNGLSNYEKLKYGLNVDKKVYKDFEDDYFKTYNVKELIKKLK